MTNLETTYLGLKLRNPLIIGSSGLTSSVERIVELEKAGAGAIVLKSVFEEQINNEIGHVMESDPHNPGYRYPEAADYINTYIRDNSVTSHIELIKEVKKAVSLPVIVSINCIHPAEWTLIAQEFESAGADALELNMYYIPSSRNDTSEVIEQNYLNVVSKVKEKVKIPVSVKIGDHFTNIAAMAEKFKGVGAKGIVMFNRFYEPDINLSKLELSASGVFSHRYDFTRSLRWVGLVSSEVPNIDIAASTGIHDADAVVKQLLAGAQATQICSVVYKNGSEVIGVILAGIRDFMKKWNFKKIEDFRGRLSYKKISDPMMYARSQFMKYYSSMRN
jgi:dihydroorotate dehydrogenase (fumarate)